MRTDPLGRHAHEPSCTAGEQSHGQVRPTRFCDGATTTAL